MECSVSTRLMPATTATMAELSLRIDKLDEEIAVATENLLKSVKVKAEVSSTKLHADLGASPELVNTLWLLKAAFQDLDALLKLLDLEAAVQSFKKLTEKVTQFTSQYPSCLLAIDCERELEARKLKTESVISEAWSSSVTLGAGQIKIFPTSEAHLVDLVVELIPELESDLSYQLQNEFIEPLIKGEVSVSTKTDENGIELLASKGAPTSLDQLFSSVNNFVNGISGTFLNERVDKKFGHYLIDSVFRHTVPAILCEQCEFTDSEKTSLDEHVKELESSLKAAGWREASDLSEAISTTWTQSHKAWYLEKLRKLLSGTLKLPDVSGPVPETSSLSKKNSAAEDEWEWNSDEDEPPASTDPGDAPEQAGEASDVDTDELISKIEDLLDEFTANFQRDDSLELFNMLFRALSPSYYGEYILLLHHHAMRLAIHLDQGPEAEKMHLFAQQKLGDVLEKYSQDIDATIIHLKISPSTSPDASATTLIKDKIAVIASEVSQQSGFSAGMRDSVLGSVIEQVAVEIINAIEALPLIGEMQSEQLSITIANLQGLSAYFPDINDAVPSWFKLMSLQDLMTANLATIRQMQHDARLVDFSSAETTSLIKALFEDSENRRSLIRDINNST